MAHPRLTPLYHGFCAGAPEELAASGFSGIGLFCMAPFSEIDLRTFSFKNLVCTALAIEQSTPGFANSRVRALPYVHPRGLGSRPSSLRGLNEEFYKKKFKTKKLRHLED